MACKLYVYIGPMFMIKRELFDEQIYRNLDKEENLSVSFSDNGFVYFIPNKGISLGRNPYNIELSESIVVEFDKIDQSLEVAILIREYIDSVRRLEETFGVGCVEVRWGIKA